MTPSPAEEGGVPTTRLGLSVACPFCGACAGELCREESGEVLNLAHLSRIGRETQEAVAASPSRGEPGTSEAVNAAREAASQLGKHIVSTEAPCPACSTNGAIVWHSDSRASVSPGTGEAASDHVLVRFTAPGDDQYNVAGEMAPIEVARALASSERVQPDGYRYAALGPKTRAALLAVADAAASLRSAQERVEELTRHLAQMDEAAQVNGALYERALREGDEARTALSAAQDREREAREEELTSKATAFDLLAGDLPMLLAVCDKWAAPNSDYRLPMSASDAQAAAQHIREAYRAAARPSSLEGRKNG